MNKVYQNKYTKRNNEKEISIKEYLLVIKKNTWIIALITIIMAVAGFFYTNQNNTPLYQTSTRIIIDSDKANMKTLMVVIKDPIIMEKVTEKLHLGISADQLSQQIGVEQLDESQVVKISVTNGNSEMATRIANTTAETFKREIVHILDFRGVRILSDATDNPYPINQTQNRNIILAAIMGAVIGTGMAFLLDSLDTKVRKEQEVEDVLGVPVIGVVVNMSKKRVAAKKNTKQNYNLVKGGETIESKKTKVEVY